MSDWKASDRQKPDWVAIRQLYEGTRTPLSEIAASHKVSLSAIKRRRLAEGWQKRSPKKSSETPKPAKRSENTERSHLISRLLRIIDRNLELLEMRIQTEDPGSAADRERETRAIGMLTRTIEKLTELQSQSDDTKTSSAKVSSGSHSDEDEAVRLRLEIAERILRLRERNIS